MIAIDAKVCVINPRPISRLDSREGRRASSASYVHVLKPRTHVGKLATEERKLSERSAQPDQITRALNVWQARTKRKLVQEDCRQIVSNLADFITILSEWEAADRSRDGKFNSSDESPPGA